MANGIVLKKIDHQIELIQNILIKFFKHTQNVNKVISEIKNIKSIKTNHINGIRSICVLEDKRIALSTNKVEKYSTSSIVGKINSLYSEPDKPAIVVYDYSFQPKIQIKDPHKGGIYSLCVLRNGDLLSSGEDKTIKIWGINQSDYQLIHTLKTYYILPFKIIELKDGKLCSHSRYKIEVWDKSYCISTVIKEISIQEQFDSVVEVNNFIVSILRNFYRDVVLKLWDKSNYQCVKSIEDIEFNSKTSMNRLSKLNDKTVLIGGDNVLYLFDIETNEKTTIEYASLDCITCFNVLSNGLVLIGNKKGEILIYDSLFNQVIFKKQVHDRVVICLVGDENSHLISSSLEGTFNIYN